MGRTIHYLVEDKQENILLDEQWRQIEQLQDKYNKNHNWSCEQLSLQRFTLYPNWDAWKDSSLTTSEIWEEIHQRLKEPDGLQKLRLENLINYEEGGYMGKGYLLSGFTKVRDYEEDAALVVKFLIEISTIAPDLDIKVSDEGDYLKCPVVLRNGKMSVDFEELQSHLEYLFKRYEEASDEDRPFWERLIKRYQPFIAVSKQQEPSYFIHSKCQRL